MGRFFIYEGVIFINIYFYRVVEFVKDKWFFVYFSSFILVCVICFGYVFFEEFIIFFLSVKDYDLFEDICVNGVILYFYRVK